MSSPNTIQIQLGTDTSQIASCIDRMLDACELKYQVDGSHRFQATLCLEEAITNAIIHGSLEVDSETRELMDGQYERLIEERRSFSPYRDRVVDVECHMQDCEVVFVVRDYGPGFDVSMIPDPTAEENLMRASGRGLLIMHSFMDGIEYNETGNQVTLRKKLQLKDTPVEQQLNLNVMKTQKCVVNS